MWLKSGGNSANYPSVIRLISGCNSANVRRKFRLKSGGNWLKSGSKDQTVLVPRPGLSDFGSHLIPRALPDGSSPDSRQLLGTARSASGTVANTSGEEEIHLRIGNPPLAMRAVTSSRKVTASVSLPQDVYKSSTKMSRLTTAAAVGHLRARLTCKNTTIKSKKTEMSMSAKQERIVQNSYTIIIHTLKGKSTRKLYGVWLRKSMFICI